MKYILSILGIILSILMLKYREIVGDMLGEADWMRAVGGIYTLVVFLAIVIFLWSLAELTGTTDILLAPLVNLLPGR